METTVSRKATVACGACGRLNRVDLARAHDGPKCGACGRPITLDRPLKLTDDNFEKVVGGSEVPVLVDFYADWCGPCKMMAPAVDEVARGRVGSALVAKLDTDANPRTAARFGIRSLPTVVVFRGGREAARQMGAMPRQMLERMLDAGG